MPAVLERCVAHVMSRPDFSPQEGKTAEESAWAICNASLGMVEAELADEEMQRKVHDYMSTTSFTNNLKLRRTVPIARAIGKFVNGQYEGNLSKARLQKLVDNFKKHPRQVPVYLLTGQPNPEHPEDLDSRMADGWVEGLEMRGDELIGDLKLHGAAAQAIVLDQVRGASIGTISGKDYTGDDIGEVLEHVVLTNQPFVKGMNIAAKGKPAVAAYFTDYSMEATMAEDKKEAKPAPKDDGSLVEKYQAAEIRMQEMGKQIRDLTASNENLTEELKARQENQETEALLVENRRKDRRIMAMRVRELVSLGQSRGQFRRDEVLGFEGGDDRSDEITLAWFKNSIFEGDMKLLEFSLRTREKKSLGRAYHSGTPEADASTYTDAEKAEIQKLRKNPEELEATRGAKTFTDWKAKRKAAGLEPKAKG